MSAARTPPWKKPLPKKKRTKLTAASRKSAKARAAKAGRAYPNLVDNMAAARAQKSKKRKASAKRRTSSRK